MIDTRKIKATETTSRIFKENKFKPNFRNKTDGLLLLQDIEDGVVAAAFFDPQYRGVLDKLKYGNEGKSRGKARCDLPQMDEKTIISFVKQLDRVIRDSGYLFLWVDKFHLCEGIQQWLTGTSFHLVDMVVWDKDKIGMGYRTRRKSEYLVVLQKEPLRARATWSDHSIPDVWREKVVKNHPHSKPLELQKRLITATSSEGDIILDPASGGYSVFEACKQCNRTFIGGDIEYGEDEIESVAKTNEVA